ncbi:7-carboxy-7-deazaguanine synthase QueE [Hymenobacter sp. BT559]|uniref:7-carboxy-7-deazaguanine synthase QueE n=1 Tax=Hymenobacter sp. BT559 TaxID=2795729 RepID=UPI0018EBE039|nr:7-carboxy-7-deazaguanine synthase QueE [Hymenobacter sp. BT559]MBJ6146302.1 7-carboxy-7-deazaguanine synthase QueE [Hymenobacter sp. BT559]
MDRIVNEHEVVGDIQKRTYRVKNVWKTLQGEGLFAGRPAVFVRFVGCNLWSGYEASRERDIQRTGASCPGWCDTDFTKEGSTSYSAAQLAQTIREVGGDIRFCVLTGGEPLLHIDAELMNALHAEDFFVAIETNGTLSLAGACWSEQEQQLMAPDWIVCSPKLVQERLELEFFDELKIVVPDYMPRDFTSFTAKQRVHTAQNAPLPLLWIQPEDGPRLRENQRLAIELALEQPQWRVSVQTHKILDVE